MFVQSGLSLPGSRVSIMTSVSSYDTPNIMHISRVGLSLGWPHRGRAGARERTAAAALGGGRGGRGRPSDPITCSPAPPPLPPPSAPARPVPPGPENSFPSPDERAATIRVTRWQIRRRRHAAGARKPPSPAAPQLPQPQGLLPLGRHPPQRLGRAEPCQPRGPPRQTPSPPEEREG